MAITVKHSKTSAIPDAGDTTLVQPSDWNADHTLTGTVPVANGGTGASTANGGFNALAPSQTGNSGKYLTTDGTDTSWATNPLGTVTSVAATAGTGIAVTGSPITTSGTLNITNTAPDQTVVLTAGNGISTTGTYPNFTITNTSPSAGGDVVGPASATDNAVARFDTTTGKLIQNSVTLIDDTGNASGILSQQFSNGSAVTLAAGKMWYDGSTGAWNAGMGNGNITQQIGEELFIYGKASAAITDSPLQIVYHTGTVGASGVITFAPTIAGITDENAIVGVATENIALNGFGRVTTFGVVRGITTNGTAFGETWADDDVIWYNPVTGNPTKVKPSAPNIKFQIGLVIKAGSGGSGSFQVALVQGTALGGTDSNVKLNGVTNGQIISYDGGNGYWKNTDLTAGTGISVSKSVNGVLTVTNTSPSSGGTVTSVTGTSPVVSSGGNTPAISMPAATGSVNGYLTSADWTTFNNKGSGTVTSVTGTSPVVSSGGATPAISMAAANTTTNGYLTSTDWNTFNGKGAGTVTSVGGTGTVNGITLTGTVTSSGNLTLGGTLSNVSLATQVTGNLPVTNLGSGTGASTSTYWRGDGTWASVSASTATNLAGGALGSVPYQLLSGTTTFLAGNTTTTPQFLTSTGVAGIATAPSYTGSTGSGNVVLATSPTLVTPALGTPSALIGTNITGTASGLSIGGNAATATTATNVSGTVAIANGGTGQTTAAAAFNALDPMTTTGDLIYASAANTAARLGVGSTGQVLTVAGGVPTWAAASGGGAGRVIQVVNNVAGVNFSTSSTSYVDTGMNATITPSSSSSKILAIVSFTGFRVNSGYLLAKLYRNTTDVTTAGNGFFGGGNDSSNGYDSAPVNFTLIDSPSSTSSITYRIYGRYDGGGTSSLFGPSGNTAGTGQYPNYSITLMEISG